MFLVRPSASTVALVLLHLVQVPGISASFEGNDYISPTYALAHSTRADTSAAQQAIIDAANAIAKSGPWSARSKNTVAASGDPKDYLSWAPYWWPDCNWCTHGTNANSTIVDNTKRRRSHRKRLDDSSSTSEAFFTVETDSPTSESASELATTATDSGVSHGTVAPTTSATEDEWGLVYYPAYKQNGAQKGTKTPTSTTSTSRASTSTTDDLTTSTAIVPMSSATTPAASATSGSCRPSPTTSMAPSATYSTCPYIRKDGQVNLDVRTLPGPSALTHATQATLLNALAYALTGTSEHASNAVQYIRTFFLDSETGINPNAAYAQVVRGPPGNQEGGYEGVLDFRGLVKVVNAVQVLRASGSPEWTNDVEEGIKSWAGRYIGWLQSSTQGEKAKSVSNNHVTFYYNQLAALQILQEDKEGAMSSLQAYFTGPFQKQIDASGEQPYEASRTRPFHYRCFNIEAMITNAKLGSSLNLDLWSSRTSTGSTIQTAVDYAMHLNPGSEDASELLPHVAAVAAVYGDADGKYNAFLNASGIDYQSQAWWFYDQPEAFDSAAGSKREIRVEESGDERIELDIGGHHFNPTSQASASTSGSTTTLKSTTSTSPVTPTSSTIYTSASSASTNPASASVFQPTPGPMPPSPPDDGNSTSTLRSASPSITASSTSSSISPFLDIAGNQRVKAESG